MKKGTLKKVLRYAGKYRILIAVSMILAIVTALLSLYVPILAGRAVDQLLGKGAVDFGKVVMILTEMVVSVLIVAICQWIMNKANYKITFQVVRDVRREAFDKLQKLCEVVE